MRFLQRGLVALSLLMIAGAAHAQHGSFTWRGSVDDRAAVRIVGRKVYYVTTEGKPVYQAGYHFTNALPHRHVFLKVRKLRGRGRITLLENPAKRNKYTAYIEVSDLEPGRDSYEFIVRW